MNPSPQGNPLHSLAREQQVELSRQISGSSAADACDWTQTNCGVEASVEQMVEFYAWFNVCRPLIEASIFADTIRKTLESLPGPKIEGETLSDAAQKIFEMKAIVSRNKSYFTSQRKLRQRDLDLGHDARRVALLEKRAALADEAEKALRAPKRSIAEQDARMREIFGLAAREK